jgi:hypothetical protein
MIRLCASGMIVILEPAHAQAGMPVVLLDDLARMRLQTISFFLLGFLLCSGIIRQIWNGLAKEFPRLPRLDFRRALGLVTIWGLLFVLILTMISGARELMTPGAWKKQGFTYAVAEGPERTLEAPAGDAVRSVLGDENDPARREALDRLRVQLWRYAQAHDGRFPTAETMGDVPPKAWQIADASGLRFVYRPGLVADEGASPLAYEPGLFGPERWALLTDGTLKKMSIAEIREAISPVHAKPDTPGQRPDGPGR